MLSRVFWPLRFRSVRNARFLAEADMESTYDIFRKLPDGAPIWVCAVRSIEEAKSQLLELRSAAPGEYFVFDSAAKAVVVIPGEPSVSAKKPRADSAKAK
jgi:hypothetical protein